MNGTRINSIQGTQKILIENSAFLFSITEVPGKEREHELPANDGNHQLTVEHEKQLAEDFAFISANTDEMDRVKAVAIEESPENHRMTIRLASNTGDSSRIKLGFARMGNVLQNAASRGWIFPCVGQSTEG